MRSPVYIVIVCMYDTKHTQRQIEDYLDTSYDVLCMFAGIS